MGAAHNKEKQVSPSRRSRFQVISDPIKEIHRFFKHQFYINVFILI